MNKRMIDRFKDDKYTPISKKEKETSFSIGTVSPSNIYDFQKMFSLSKEYKIPIINDINYNNSIIPFQHIRLNMSLYNNIIDFNEKEKRIKIQSGASISSLLNFLSQYNLTIEELEKYKDTDMSIGDCLYNNYYGYDISNIIEEFSVITPKETILIFKPFCDFTMNHFDISQIFLKSSNTLGIILDIKLKVAQKKNYSYIKINNTNKSIIEILSTYKYDELTKNSYIIDSFDGNSCYLKIEEKNTDKKINELLCKGIKFTKVSYYDMERDVNKFLFPLRKVIIHLNEEKKEIFIQKYKKALNEIFKDNKDILYPIMKIPSKNTEAIEIILPSNEDIKLIEKEFYMLRELYNIVSKLNGNFYINQNVIVNSKYDLMREIGYNNYFIYEDIKKYFDPHYLLNPHLCFPKPKFVNFIKRNNRIWNYLFTKAKI